MNHQQATSLQTLLTEAYLIRPKNLVSSFSQGNRVDRLANTPSGVVGVSKIKRQNDDYALRVFIEQPAGASKMRLLSRELDVLETDIEVITVGALRAFNSPVRGRVRPAPVGCSVGHFNITAGTLGGIVRDDVNTYLLSNNHVLADENRAAVGDDILQPGPADGGSAPSDVIARLERFIPLDFTGINRVDAAIATPGNLADLINSMPSSIPFVGAIRGITTPTSGMTVAKYGRTTGFTVGTIGSLSSNVTVGYLSGSAFFEDQLEIDGLPGQGPFSQPGDSGSVIVDLATKRAVGLLFAGDELTGITFANPISTAHRVLGVTFV